MIQKMENYMIQKMKIYMDTITGSLHSRARAGSGSDREAIGEGPHPHSVGSFTNEVK